MFALYHLNDVVYEFGHVLQENVACFAVASAHTHVHGRAPVRVRQELGAPVQQDLGSVSLTMAEKYIQNNKANIHVSGGTPVRVGQELGAPLNPPPPPPPLLNHNLIPGIGWR